jgi:hypothetical protein
MTIQERLNNFALYKLTEDEQEEALRKDLQGIIVATLAQNDAVVSITAHEAFIAPLMKALQKLTLPENFDTGSPNVTWEDANEEFQKYCDKIAIRSLTNEELESFGSEALANLEDSQLFIQVLRSSEKLNYALDSFLESSGTIAKLTKARLPFQPTIQEKRFLAMLVALLAPVVEKESDVLVGTVMDGMHNGF